MIGFLQGHAMARGLVRTARHTLRDTLTALTGGDPAFFVSMSNRAIADRLVVSVRTIEGHVLRACRKLDLPDRAALGALLGR